MFRFDLWPLLQGQLRFAKLISVYSSFILGPRGFVFIYLFGVLHRFQHCTGHITTGCWKGRGNQYIEFVRVLYCKLPTNGKQLPAFPLEAVLGSNPGLRGGRRECYHSTIVAPLGFVMRNQPIRNHRLGIL